MMRVAFSLPALRAYRDRLQMVCALSDLVDELYLLTDEVDDETAPSGLCASSSYTRLAREKGLQKRPLSIGCMPRLVRRV